MGIFLKAAGIGAIAGMRTFSAPTWVAYAKHSPRRKLLLGFAVFELFADKLPQLPNRITPSQFLGRILSGSLSAYFESSQVELKTQRRKIAFVGAASAGASTVLAFHLRKFLGNRLRIRDFFLGMSEDALMFSSGRWLFKNELARKGTTQWKNQPSTSSHLAL